MAKIIVIYYSQGGNTRKMAEFIAGGVKMEGVEASVKNISDVSVEELLDYQGIIVGSPTYYGSMAAAIKKLFDDSVKYHGRLDGKIGAAFSSSANVGGGNETTILDILNAMLIHGMIIKGNYSGDHYGPVSIGAPDSRATNQCQRLGTEVAKLVKKLFG
ncbi:MAG: NAD(P)H-dependent oxidoreductase [Candidatus Omnitrophota bacterium]|nr:NAD(P)H-dependent oxidoreductase [Candidatus Omnitrophota bacterium]